MKRLRPATTMTTTSTTMMNGAFPPPPTNSSTTGTTLTNDEDNDDDNRKEREGDDSNDDSILDTEACWKCQGRGILPCNNNKKQKKLNKKVQGAIMDPSLVQSTSTLVSDQERAATSTTTTTITCSVCQGSGKRRASQRSIQLGKQPGKIIRLRGRQGTFMGVRAVEGYKLQRVDPDGGCGGGGGDADTGLTRNTPLTTAITTTTTSSPLVQPGEILAALGCGDWRIYQLANGHKLTVDDFLCAWYTAKELRRRGYGVGEGMFGQVPLPPSTAAATAPTAGTSCDASNTVTPNNHHHHQQHKYKTFHHADIGCGCGSVLMTMAWAFPNTIRSHGVEAQQVSFNLCRRGLQFNLGQDGSDPSHTVQLTHFDLREWDGGSLRPYHVITGTPPYFPKAHFVASQNHSQKIRCRVPTRGAASDYVAAAARLIRKPDGIICIAETARKEGEDAMWEAIQQNGLKVLRRLDVITRTGLPPRFSCWLLTTQEGACNKNDEKNEEDETCADLSRPLSTNSRRSCMIETLTIRNEDQSRTLEYVDAMESMGWVDFEMTKEKRNMGVIQKVMEAGRS